MKGFWARHVDSLGQTGPDYWRYFAQRLADLATIPDGANVLDIGTSDGNVLFKAMRRAGPRGYGVGIDIYRDGLREGIDESNRQGMNNATFAQMDVAHLGSRAGMFHTVLANFVSWDGIFDFEQMQFIAPDLWTAEIMRVLQPDGQVGIGGWVDQSDIEWIAAAIRRYLPEHVAELDRRSGGRILPYGKTNPAGAETVLREGGFRDIQVHVETAKFVSPDEETWWRQMRQVVQVYFKQIPEEGSDTLREFKEQVFSDLQEFRLRGDICFNKTVQFAFGTK